MTGKKGMTWRKKDVKHEYNKAKAAEKGRAKGQQEAHQKKPILESLREHIGKILDAEGINALIDVALFYAIYEKSKSWEIALLGPIGMRLATAESEVAAVAGCLTLASLGVGIIVPTEVLKTAAEYPASRYAVPEDAGKCPDGYTLMEKETERACFNTGLLFLFEWQGWKRVYLETPPPEGGGGGVD